MYPPQELFQTIKSIENNCKDHKKSNPELRYQVKLGPDNIKLWTQLLGEPQYSRQEPTIYGSIIQPKIDKIITLPNFGQSPPKGRTFKRPRESPDQSKITPKGRPFLNEEINLGPEWHQQSPTKIPFSSSNPSPPKESPPSILAQIMKQRTQPPSPPKTRSRSRSRTKQQKAKTNQKEQPSKTPTNNKLNQHQNKNNNQIN